MNPVREKLTITKRLLQESQLSHIVTAVRLPDGAVEIAINTDQLQKKIDYILYAYDNDMHLNTNNAIQMIDIMIVWK